MATMRKTKSAPRGAPAENATPTAARGPSSGVPHERIAKRAYEIWQSSGRPDGRHQDHWLQAERELNGAGATSQPRR